MKGLERLTHAERLQLVKFTCAAVWADLDVNRSEKSHVMSLFLRLGLPQSDVEQVQEWLETPPPAEELDPNLIPPEHRALFLEAVEEAVQADGVVDGPELESLQLLRDLLS
jgi:uncharacterized membrane protein YebE (DUF533 family)